MQRAGIIIAPRTFSSGEIVYGARSPSRFALVDTYEDALRHVHRLGSKARIRSRITTSRAATSASRSPPPRGPRISWSCPRAARSSRWTSRLIQDGNSTVEHNIPQQRFYEDVVSLWSQTQVGNNPTLVVTYGGLAGDPYWSQATQVWNHPLLTRHTPPSELAARVRATTAPADQFVDQYSARESHRLASAAC